MAKVGAQAESDTDDDDDDGDDDNMPLTLMLINIDILIRQSVRPSERPKDQPSIRLTSSVSHLGSVGRWYNHHVMRFLGYFFLQ